jgi:hypothetical protein
MTSKLQPPDVSVYKPFTHLVPKHYDAWLNKDNHILTHNGNIKRSSASIIVEWTSKGWKRSVSQYYSKIVLKCCFVNAKDGKQDDILWDNSEQCGKHASSSENESDWRIIERTFWVNKKDRKECACSENFKFPFHSGIFSITFQFKCVLNILF